MKKIKFKRIFDEIISLAKIAGMKDNNHLSQNLLAVTPYRQNWLFYCQKSDKDTASPSYMLNLSSDLRPFMVWLIVQNKPVGEYVQRLLTEPRVRPHRPFLGLLTQNQLLGVFAMKTNAILSHSLAVLTDEYHRYNALHDENPYAGYADRANAIYNAIHALKSHASTQGKAITPPRPKNACGRILGVFVGGAK